ncbi:MAG TPA: SUMF1/EgtB/PvdO family nonheme iron enzyme [Anaerolineaceae bacterium]|nr:SUMF1/EgtB/PvdO family nonheme iron enzyme [Anaerolineaceae bacterium]HOG79813.1 SUMF1/EgtB/PvdO family nonheme iron enzyme [Anaerolineaceae bacterium]
MEAFLGLLVGALGYGLVEIAKKTADLVIDPALEPAKNQIKAWLQKNFTQQQRDDRLKTTILQALTQLSLPKDEDPLRAWAQQTALDRLTAPANAALRRQFALAVLAHTNPHAEPPPDLLLALRWPLPRRAELTSLLTALRQKLADNPDWQPLLHYFTEAAQLNLLTGLLSAVQKLLDAVIQTPSGPALLTVSGQPVMPEADFWQIQAGYCDKVKKCWSEHLISGLAPEAGRPVQMPLAEMYFEPALLPARDPRERIEEEQKMLTRDALERLNHEMARGRDRLVEAFGQHPRLVLLGKPGSGKTITLHYTALMLAQGESGAARLGLPASALPILIRLADYAINLTTNPGQTLHQALTEEFLKLCPYVEHASLFLEKALQQGRCLILLDGLDEVGDFGQKLIDGQTLHQVVLKRIREFEQLYCRSESCNRILITSRLEGYAPGSLPGFAEAELSPLSFPDEVQTFLVYWFTAYRQRTLSLTWDQARYQAAQSVQDDLMPKIAASPGVTLLATNPLLLTILALLFAMGKRLPNQRVELYKMVVMTMIENWRHAQTDHASRLFDHIQPRDILRVLAELSFWLHSQLPGGTMMADQWQAQTHSQLLKNDLCLPKEAAALTEDFLDYARRENGLLTERSAGRFGFFHLTLEEYLAAWKIAHKPQEERQRILVERWPDPYWEEVLLLTAGELQDGEEDALKNFLLSILALESTDPQLAGRPALLAGRALADIQNRKRSLNELVIPALQAVAQDTDPISRLPHTPGRVPVATRAAAAEVCDELGWLPPDLDDFIPLPAANLRVGKYPVTNSQYARFLFADDFAHPPHWTDFPQFDEQSRPMGPSTDAAGLRWLETARQDPDLSPDGKRVLPRYWTDPRLGASRPGAPVVGLTWYEANAYCQWLAAHWANPALHGGQAPGWGIASARLLTEADYRQAASAAQYPALDRFPWDAETPTTDQAEILRRANLGPADLNRTTPVWMYPAGQSLLHIFDLAGNCWEWQANYYDKNHNLPALRGAAFLDGVGLARLSGRLWGSPLSREGARRLSGLPGLPITLGAGTLRSGTLARPQFSRQPA